VRPAAWNSEKQSMNPVKIANTICRAMPGVVSQYDFEVVAMTLPPRPVTRRDVKKFVDYCVTLRAFWTHYQTVFEGSDLKRELLQSTADKFFRDLKLMLIEHLILQICKLTDPETTMGKRNLTVQFLINNADFSASPRELVKLTKIADRIAAFRKRILPARNKLSAIWTSTRPSGADHSGVRRLPHRDSSGSTCRTS
jgi:hypothetical protein